MKKDLEILKRQLEYLSENNKNIEHEIGELLSSGQFCSVHANPILEQTYGIIWLINSMEDRLSCLLKKLE